MLSDCCLSCLSVTFLYCGQTVGWIKMKLGTEVGLGPGHIVLDGDRAPPQKGAQQPHLSAPYAVAKRLDGSIKMPLRREVDLGPGDIVLDGDPAAARERGTAPKFSAHGCCGQTAGWVKMPLPWYGDRPRPRRHCVRWGSSTV